MVYNYCMNRRNKIEVEKLKIPDPDEYLSNDYSKEGVASFAQGDMLTHGACWKQTHETKEFQTFYDEILSSHQPLQEESF